MITYDHNMLQHVTICYNLKGLVSKHDCTSGMAGLICHFIFTGGFNPILVLQSLPFLGVSVSNISAEQHIAIATEP